MDNLKLWGEVEKTDPAFTKKAKIGGMSITTIAPQYQIKMVTQQFGVYGKGWGFKNIELSYDLVEKCNLVVFKGTFFFPGGEFEIINSCKLYMDRKLTMVDDNFAKKIETDALTKAISKLGFNADIFLGKFDDVRYVNEMKEEFKAPAPLPASDVAALIKLNNCTTLEQLKDAWIGFKEEERNLPTVLAKKESLKTKLK